VTEEMTAYYARRAAEYERVYAGPRWQDDLAVLRPRVADFFVGRRVLEIACGTGFWTERAAERARDVHATDLNEDTLALARAKIYAAPVTFERRDAYVPHAPEAAPRFDAIRYVPAHPQIRHVGSERHLHGRAAAPFLQHARVAGVRGEHRAAAGDEAPGLAVPQAGPLQRPPHRTRHPPRGGPPAVLVQCGDEPKAVHPVRKQPGTRGEAERGGRELDVREIGFQGVQPLGGLPRSEDRHREDLLAEVAQGGGEVADVVGDAVPLGVGLALHHCDAHEAIFPARDHANRARGLRRGRRRRSGPDRPTRRHRARPVEAPRRAGAAAR